MSLSALQTAKSCSPIPIFLGALKNTFIIVIVSVPVTCAFSLWVSLRHRETCRSGPPAFSAACSTCPWSPVRLPLPLCGSGCTTTTTASSTIWARRLGIIDKNINWLGDERFALGCIILILLTTSVGQPIVLYVSALGNVDQSIVEAAEVDGATDFQCFWKIKWPAIMPTTLYILVITTINSFQCFALIQLLTSGGPDHRTDTIMYYIYYTAFKQYQLRLRQRHGRGAGGDHRHSVCCPVQAGRHRIIEEVRTMSATAAKKQKPLKRHPSKLKKMSAYTILAMILISIMAVLFAFPLYWIITGSFKTGAAINSTTPEWWPGQSGCHQLPEAICRQERPAVAAGHAPSAPRFSADGEPIYFSVGPTAPAALRWMINTVFMAVVSMILTCITAAMAGYALAKEALCGPQAAVHPHRVRHGSAQAGDPDPPAA